MVTQKKRSYALDCSGSSCQWSGLYPKAGRIGPKGVPTDPICEPGSSSCTVPHLLEAEESSFHDRQLVEATRKIKRILAKIPADPAGRKLSFCHTKMGILLAWVQHGGKATGRRVTAKDDNATVAKALKLKGVAAGGA